MPDAVPEHVEGTLTLKLKSVDTGGSLVSFSAEGNWDNWPHDRVFYSLDATPPAEMDGRGVWGQLMQMIGPMLATNTD